VWLKDLRRDQRKSDRLPGWLVMNIAAAFLCPFCFAGRFSASLVAVRNFVVQAHKKTGIGGMCSEQTHSSK